MLFICGGLATIINKCYAIDKTVTTNNSFCFYTNVIIFIILICVFIYLISSRKTSCEVMEVIKSIKPKSYLYVAIDTAASNISSILILVILQSMAVSKFSVYSNALGTLSVLLTSRFIFKEKITPPHILCIVLSTIAVILNAF